MKRYALPTSFAGIALTLLILAPWANFSFAKRKVADHLIDRNALAAVSNYLPAVVASNDEEQVDLAPDDVSSELPRGAGLEEATGNQFVVPGTNPRRDLGLYLSYLRERGPPFYSWLV
jgi:hypothetical protein